MLRLFEKLYDITQFLELVLYLLKTTLDDILTNKEIVALLMIFSKELWWCIYYARVNLNTPPLTSSITTSLQITGYVCKLPAPRQKPPIKQQKRPCEEIIRGAGVSAQSY